MIAVFYGMKASDFEDSGQGKAILEDFNPQSARELWLANAIAEDMWRLDRARGQENNIYALSFSGPIGAATIADDPEVHAAATLEAKSVNALVQRVNFLPGG